MAAVDSEQQEKWAEIRLKPITGATFREQAIPLDGFAYDYCTFVRCTFVYKGEKPFSLRNFKLKGDWNVEVASPQLRYFSALLGVLRFLGRDIEVADELQPSEPVAYGEVPGKEGAATEMAESPATLDEWIRTTPLATVSDKTFRNEEIELDGYMYLNCVFINPTFVFKGEKPFGVPGCRVEGSVNIDARTPQLQLLLVLLRITGGLNPDRQEYIFDEE